MGSKKAVLIGCNYPGTDEELNGCVNDVWRMYNCLVQRYGFYDGDIQVLIDTDRDFKQPTGRNIRRAITDLVRSAKFGDVLFVHFSGHGTRLPSESKDDNTGYEECIVPTDSNLITDDDLRQFVNQVPRGCRITIVADSCNSGGLIANAKEQIGESTKTQSSQKKYFGGESSSSEYHYGQYFGQGTSSSGHYYDQYSRQGTSNSGHYYGQYSLQGTSNSRHYHQYSRQEISNSKHHHYQYSYQRTSSFGHHCHQHSYQGASSSGHHRGQYSYQGTSNFRHHRHQYSHQEVYSSKHHRRQHSYQGVSSSRHHYHQYSNQKTSSLKHHISHQETYNSGYHRHQYSDKRASSSGHNHSQHSSLRHHHSQHLAKRESEAGYRHQGTLKNKYLSLSNLIEILKRKSGRDDICVGKLRLTLFDIFGEDVSPKIKLVVNALNMAGNLAQGLGYNQVGEILNGIGNLAQNFLYLNLEDSSKQVTCATGTTNPTRPRRGILISACQSDETAADYCPSENPYEAYGALSNAIQMIIDETNAKVTNRKLVLKARQMLKEQGFTQRPGLYCSDDDADARFLS